MPGKNSRAISKSTQAELPIFAEHEIERKIQILVDMHRELVLEFRTVQAELPIRWKSWASFKLPHYGPVPRNEQEVEEQNSRVLQSIVSECVDLLENSFNETGNLGLLIQKGIFLMDINDYLEKKVLGEDWRRTLAKLDRKYTDTSLEDDFRNWKRRIDDDFLLVDQELSTEFTELNRTIYRRLRLFLRRQLREPPDPTIYFELLEKTYLGLKEAIEALSENIKNELELRQIHITILRCKKLYTELTGPRVLTNVPQLEEEDD